MLNSNTISWIEQSSKERISNNSKSRLYPYLFDERLYFNATNDLQDNNISDTQAHSFLKIKRIINELRSKQYPACPNERGMNIYRNLSLNDKKHRRTSRILHPITRILNIIESDRNIEKQKQTDISPNKRNQYSSIHRALCTIEYNWQFYGSIYKGIIPSILHPEIMIRILRTMIHDVAFLHCLRELFYHRSLNNRIKEDIFTLPQKNTLDILLFNWYIVEYEKFFFLEIPHFFLYQDSLRKDSNQDSSIVQKISIWDSWKVEKKKVTHNMLTKNNNVSCTKNPKRITNFERINTNLYCNIYQYIRTKNISFVNLETTQKNIDIFQKRYDNFMRYRLGYTNEKNHWSYQRIENSYIFLGYILQFKTKQLFIRIDTNSYKRKTYILQKSIFLLNPLLSIIRILATYRFCTYFGYPISKSGWSTYSDLIIVDRFKRIKDSLVKYYSGSLNQKDLSKINHILHYSCAKTLACKHKTNLKKIWKKYGKNLSIRYPVQQRKIVQMSRTKTNETTRIHIRFWNFYYHKPDPISIVLEKKYRLSIK